MKRITEVLLGTVISFVLLWGCQKEDVVLTDPDKFTRPINLDAPIFQAHFSAFDLLERIDSTQYIATYNDGLIYLKVDTSFIVVPEEVVSFDDMVLDKTYTLPGGIKAAIPVTYIDTVEAAGTEGQRIDSMTIRSAQMDVTVSSPASFTGTFTIEFPELTLDGVSLKLNGVIGQPFNQAVDCQGYHLSFFQNNNDVSSFHSITTIDLDIPAPGTPAGDFRISFSFKIFEPEIIWGFFSSKELYSRTGSLDFDMGDGFAFTENIEFKDVLLYIVVNNGFGAPMKGTIDTMTFFTDGENPVDLELYGDNTIYVTSATYGNPVIPATDSLLINNSNSNLVEAINTWPNQIYYRVSGNINPDGDVAQNFLVNDGKTSLSSDVRIELPFWFKSEGYYRTDTIDFDLRNMIEDSTTIDYLEELNLYFDFLNGFPLNITAQAYAVNAQGEVVDSLFSDDQVLWNSPEIDANDKAGEPVLTKVDVQLLNDKIKSLWDKNVVQLHLKSKVYTGGKPNTPEVPDFVKLYTQYTIDIKLSIKLISGDLSN